MTTREKILHALQRYGELSQRELAQAVNVTVRTVRRHVHRLRDDGAVAVRASGAHRLYRLTPAASPLPPAEPLTEREAEALTVAAKAARTLLAPTPFIDALEDAVGKLSADWVHEVLSFEPEREDEHWSFDAPAGPAPFDRAVFRDVLTAVRNRIPLLADYQTASTGRASRGRRLHPLGIVIRDSSWMLAAFCCRDQRVKDFALAGFTDVTPLADERFEPPAGFAIENHARDRFRAIGGDEVHVVRLHASPEAARYFARKHYHPTQQIEAIHPDGSASVSFEVEGIEEISSWLLSWGPKIVVQEPEDLVALIVSKAEGTLDQY